MEVTHFLVRSCGLVMVTPLSRQANPDAHEHRSAHALDRLSELRKHNRNRGPVRREDRGAGDSLMNAALELEGYRALVTGGTKGVGEAVVTRLCEAGAKVLST